MSKKSYLFGKLGVFVFHRTHLKVDIIEKGKKDKRVYGRKNISKGLFNSLDSKIA